MASTAFVSSGLEFVPNNYSAPLSNENAPEAFHLMQNFLAQSPIGRALVEPGKLSAVQIKSFWETGIYDDGGDSGTPSLVFGDSIQVEHQPEPVNTEASPTKPIRTGGRTKHGAFKPARIIKPATEVGVSKSSVLNSVGTSKKSRAKRPRSDDVEDSETLHHRRRRLVADYLFDDVEVVPEAVPEDVPVTEQCEAPEADVIEEVVVNDETTVPIEDRVNSDEAPEVLIEPILEMNNEEKFEAHPAVSICDPEDVAADQATLVIEESMATHTEILSVTNQIPELGEEVDQAAKSVSSEKIVEVENMTAVQEKEKIVEEVNSEKVQDEAVAEKVQDEVAQLNTEATAENAFEEAAEPIQDNVDADDDQNSEHSLHANSGINVEISDSDEPFLGDPTAESIKEKQTATKAHYREMYYSNWSGADCIFSKQRTADFVDKSAKEISNPELLSHLKATIVQVKSLNNRFDETHKVVMGLSNDIVAKELALKSDRARFSSIIKDQVEIKQRLSKGERVPKDKCKRALTLRRRDDATDGGSKEAERRSKTVQEQGRLRSNSAKLTNSERLNYGGQSSSRLKSLVISANPTTVEEIAAKLFIEEHGGEATVEDMDAEMQILAEEHKKKVEAVDASEKGKGKLVEEGQFSKKNYSTSDVAQVESRLNQLTSDVAQVDSSVKVVTTSDNAQVVQTQLSPQLQGFKRPILPETLKPESVNFLQTRTVLGKESYDKSGLGSHREKRINNSHADLTSLAEPGVGVTQENLDKLESVQMIYHRGLKKEFLLYFMDDGRVYRVGEADIHLKLWEELEYVLYLLKIKNRSTHDAALVLRDRMMKSKVLLGGGVSSAYIPKYRDAYGKIVEMKRNSARFKTALGIKVLEFNLESDKSYFIRLENEMRKNSIYSLRDAIYQTGESNPELKELKEIMVDELEKAERRLLIDYLRTVPDIEEIK
ncbi:hypothetical protein POM88_025721 [Heracleum sosnowskyi]|uniref:Uncharacterized protein n=1 Tax=Heracleum sosnowskyi TaxID=360622 RepID=A0AAD8MN66_9APIA|nr:hypothetical protein POM88_025721 [Heracleum sosnowskyi]